MEVTNPKPISSTAEYALVDIFLKYSTFKSAKDAIKRYDEENPCEKIVKSQSMEEGLSKAFKEFAKAKLQSKGNIDLILKKFCDSYRRDINGNIPMTVNAMGDNFKKYNIGKVLNSYAEHVGKDAVLGKENSNHVVCVKVKKYRRLGTSWSGDSVFSRRSSIYRPGRS